MASLQEYCEKLSTDALKDVLQNGVSEYSIEVILEVCAVLLEREPGRTDVQQIIQQFVADISEV